MALLTTLVLCAMSQELVMSVSVRRAHVVLLTAGFKGGGNHALKKQPDIIQNTLSRWEGPKMSSLEMLVILLFKGFKVIPVSIYR